MVLMQLLFMVENRDDTHLPSAQLFCVTFMKLFQKT